MSTPATLVGANLWIEHDALPKIASACDKADVAALHAWLLDRGGIALELDAAGNVTGLTVEDNLTAALDDFCEAAGPFARAGSFVELETEDGTRCRWSFDGSSCTATET
jgi:hypothetical protein